jgi:DNA-binding transcriptional LysR family regulator
MATDAGPVRGLPWHGVELRHLIALEAIARERSFSAAAGSLGYTQSAISGQITMLERRVGATLFQRLPGSRGVRLTAEGEVLLEHVSAITDRLQAARVDLESVRDGKRERPLRVGTFQSVSMTLLPPLLSRLAAMSSPTRPEIRDLQDGDQLLELVERGDLDLAFTTLPALPGPFETIEILRDPYVLIVNPEYPLADEAVPVPIERLATLPIVALERCRPQVVVEDALQAAGVVPSVITRLEDFASIAALAEARLGFGLVTSLVARYAHGLRVLPLEERMVARRVGLAWHSDRTRTRELERFIDATRFVAADFGDAPAGIARLPMS